MLERPATDELAHHRVAAEPLGVVDVLISDQAREDRLAQEPSEAIATVPAGAGIGEQLCRPLRQAEGIVEFPVQQQPPSELMEESRNASFTDRSNRSRRGPDSASPAAFTAKSPLRHG